MYIADLHTHSRYSRATSKECTPEYLDLWARRKGIHLIGSGDFTHPAWREELKEKLKPAEDGFYVSGSVGAQKRHPSDRERGFYASGMERRVKRKIKARRRRILCAEKRIQDSGWEYAGSHDSPIRDHRRDQFYL